MSESMKRANLDIFTDESGQPRVLRGVAIYSGSTRLAEMAIRLGFKTVWIEMEHGPVDFSLAESLCQAAESGGGIGTIRVSDSQRGHILRALEVGARIVVVPMINTADEAKRIVRYGKFPPVGSRGYNTRSRGVGYGLAGTKDSFADANAHTHLFAQIETLEAVKNCDDMCSTHGMSGIFIGPGDLSVSLGCPGDLANGELIRIVCDCICQARAAGKHAGILVAPGPLLDAAMEAGCDLCFCGGDLTDLVKPWRALLDRFCSGGESS